MADVNSAAHQIVATYRALASGSQPSKTQDPEKNRAVGLLIAGMSTHFYKDDVSAEQMAMKTIDFCLDLADYTTTEIQSAFANYRQDGKNKTFPRPGQIRDLCGRERADRLAASRPRPVMDSRPIRWWDRPKDRWEPHWRESDVPENERIRDSVGEPFPAAFR